MDLLTKQSTTVLFISGAMAVIFGIVAAFFPGQTAGVLVILWAIYALVDGAIALFGAFSGGFKGGYSWFLVVTGALGLVAGILVLANPFEGAAVLVVVLGIWLIARGVMMFISAFSAESTQRWLLLLAGALFALAGVLLVSHPVEGIEAIALWLGVIAIAWGTTLLVAGYMGRRAAQQAEGEIRS